MKIIITKDNFNGEKIFNLEISDHGFKGHLGTIKNSFVSVEGLTKYLNHYIGQYLGQTSKDRSKTDTK
jgi:hypothetical protein